MAALAAILLPSFLTAQITFQRTYGGAGYDIGKSVQQTTDGGYIIAGATHSFGTGDFDVYLIKTDSTGDSVWTRTYGGAGRDEGLWVQQTADGGFIVAGFTSSFGAGGSDVYLIKTDGVGDTMWTSTYGDTNGDYGHSVRQTADGGFIVAGETWSFGASQNDVYLIKTDADGNTQWTRRFGGSDVDYATSLQETADSGYIIAGSTYSYGAGGRDVYLIKTDADGDTLWTRTFGGEDDDVGYSVQLTADCGYVIAGYTTSFGAGYNDVYLIKTDSTGDSVWTRTYGGAGTDCGRSVQRAANGGYIIAGRRQLLGAGYSDVYLVATDANGDTVWTRTLGGTDDDDGWAVRQTADGGYIITGYTESFGAGGLDVYLIKTDSLGNVAVAEPKASPTRASDLTITCQPNPATGATTVRLSPLALRHSPLALRIYDAQGSRVRTFTVNRVPYTVWDGTDELGHVLPSGTYFAVLTAAGQHATARIVLQR
jgi:hypothetical protein